MYVISVEFCHIEQKTTLFIGGRYSFEQGGLRVLNISTSDNGLYTCQAEVMSKSRIRAVVIEVTVYS